MNFSGRALSIDVSMDEAPSVESGGVIRVYIVFNACVVCAARNQNKIGIRHTNKGSLNDRNKVM